MNSGIDDINNSYGVAIDASAVRIERVLPGPLERVWAYLTESEKRGQWLATGHMDLREGGYVDLHFLHADLSPEQGAIPERYRGMENGHDQPRRLSMTWGGARHEPSEVTFELTPEADDVRLVVTHRLLPTRAEMLSVAGGWHAHFGILLDRLNGRTPPNFWKAHARLQGEYERLLTNG